MRLTCIYMYYEQDLHVYIINETYMYIHVL